MISTVTMAHTKTTEINKMEPKKMALKDVVRPPGPLPWGPLAARDRDGVKRRSEEKQRGAGAQAILDTTHTYYDNHIYLYIYV